jgi:quercetin dioxygenase-like cupin family protein
MNRVFVGIAVAISSVAFTALLPAKPFAQTPGAEAKPILTAPITDVEGKETVVLAITLAPGASVPMHIHPGDCVGTVSEGTIELVVEGKEPRRVAAGEAFSNPRGTVHGYKNVGASTARLTNFLVVEKGKPRTQMLPAPPK